MPYARVAVDMSTRQKVKLLAPDPRGEWDAESPWVRTFHYRIPAELEGRVMPGQLAWVPFGRQQAQGIVTALDPVAPVPDLREITRLVYETPVLTVAQIALARWMSAYYLVPLFDALALLLPIGLLRKPLILLRVAEPAPREALPADQAAIVEAIRQAQPMRQGQAERRFDKAALEALLARGWLMRQEEMPPPSVRPQMEEFARLAVGPDQLAWKKLELGRDNALAAALRWLHQRRETQPTCSLERLAAEAEVAPAAIRALEKKGLVRVRPSPEGQAVELALGAEETAAAIAELRGATKQLALLEALRQLPPLVPLRELRKMEGFSPAAWEDLLWHGLAATETREVWRDPLAGREYALTDPPRFTDDQERVWEAIAPAIAAGEHQVFLVHGVTGSGKTEIYLRAARQVVERGQQVIALVPEISLTPQTIRRFAARFPGRLAVIHSQLSPGERYDAWRRIRDGHVDVVVGPRSALFAPLPHLGLIVLDEEHETSYKQEDIPGQQVPSYQARDVAAKLGELAGCPVILGSATPSLTSYYRAERGIYRLVRMPQRIMGHGPAEDGQVRYMDLPPVAVVDLRQELRAGNRSILSRALQAALQETLARGEQAILFLNRRGAATFVLCRDCGHVVKCPRCDIPMTYHASEEMLLCHRCNRRLAPPATCPQCGSKRIRYFGVGTQKVEEVARELYPEARILRWDSDIAAKQESHETILAQFMNHEADILIGTQMIAKGLDLPLVTLVGVVTADTALNLPDFRAGERTFQLMEQVAGRAGRSALGGRVIIQTYAPEHYAIAAASRHDYEGFYRQEMDFRRAVGYPPLNPLAKLVCSAAQPDTAAREAAKLARELGGQQQRLGLQNVVVIGPAPCFFSPVGGRHRWQILLLGSDLHKLLEATPIAPGWYLDIDPVSVL